LGKFRFRMGLVPPARSAPREQRGKPASRESQEPLERQELRARKERLGLQDPLELQDQKALPGP